MSSAVTANFLTYASISRSRLQSLYSDFSPQKQSNPAGFQSNVDWWRRTFSHLLGSAAQPCSSDVLILHVNSALLDGLRREDLGVGKPLGIASVLIELCASSTVVPLAAFYASTQSIYYPGSLPARVASYLIGKPLWWALEQLNIVGDGESIQSEEKRWKKVQGDYVFLPLLEQAADAVLDQYRSKPRLSLSQFLYNPDTFQTEFAPNALPGVTLSSSDIKVLLKFLERDKGVIVTSKDAIKFVDKESETENAHFVTQVDHGVLEMKLAVDRLQNQIDNIHRQIEEQAMKVTEHLRRKRKEMAMSCLRSRKQLEDLLSKRLRSLETIQSTLLQVESAAGDIEIMKAYETSTITLKSLLAHPLLQRGKIDETMEAMAEATADHAEIEEAIRLGGDGIANAAGIGMTMDEDELQRELDQIIEEREKEEAAQREFEALERVRKEKERVEAELGEAKTREREREREQEREASKRMGVDVESMQTSLMLQEAGTEGEAGGQQWEERWMAGQAEKAAQAHRDKEAENNRRARWEDEDVAQAVQAT